MQRNAKVHWNQLVSCIHRVCKKQRLACKHHCNVKSLVWVRSTHTEARSMLYASRMKLHECPCNPLFCTFETSDAEPFRWMASLGKWFDYFPLTSIRLAGAQVSCIYKVKIQTLVPKSSFHVFFSLIRNDNIELYQHRDIHSDFDVIQAQHPLQKGSWLWLE